MADSIGNGETREQAAARMAGTAQVRRAQVRHETPSPPRAAPRSEPFSGLLFASKLLRIIAILSYVGGAFGMIAAFLETTHGRPGAAQMTLAWLTVVAGALMHIIAEIGLAVRAIALRSD